MKTMSLPASSSEKTTKEAKVSWMDQLRMDRASYKHLLTLVTPELTKLSCTLSPEDRLKMALKYLATGEGYTLSLEETITKTCLTFVEVLGEEFLSVSLISPLHNNPVIQTNSLSQVPKTAKKWRKLATTFEKWGFPNCLTAIVSRHVEIDPPACQEELYLNDFGEPTMLLIAGVDGNFKFTWAEFGLCGQTENEEMLVVIKLINS